MAVLTRMDCRGWEKHQNGDNEGLEKPVENHLRFLLPDITKGFARFTHHFMKRMWTCYKQINCLTSECLPQLQPSNLLSVVLYLCLVSDLYIKVILNPQHLQHCTLIRETTAKIRSWIVFIFLISGRLFCSWVFKKQFFFFWANIPRESMLATLANNHIFLWCISAFKTSREAPTVRRSLEIINGCLQELLCPKALIFIKTSFAL